MSATLKAKLDLDGSGFALTLNQAKSQADQFASRFKTGVADFLKGQWAAIASAAAIEELIRRTVEYGDKISEASQRTHQNVKELQELDYAASKSGATLEEVTGIIRKLGKAKEEALGGGATSKGLLEAFSGFGMSQSDLTRLNPSDIFRIIGSAYQRTGGGSDMDTAFMELGGRGATSVIPMFISGLDEASKALREMGAVISDQDIKGLSDLADIITDLKFITRATAAGPASDIAAYIRDRARFNRVWEQYKGEASNPIDFLKAFFTDAKGYMQDAALAEANVEAGGVSPEAATLTAQRRSREAAKRAADTKAAADQAKWDSEVEHEYSKIWFNEDQERRRERAQAEGHAFGAAMKGGGISNFEQMGIFLRGLPLGLQGNIAERQLRVQEEIRNTVNSIREKATTEKF